MANEYIPRDIENHIIQAARHFPSLVVTGPRQAGKSTLLKTLFQKTHAYVSLDDLLARERALRDPRLFLSDLGEKMIIDEIQYAGHLLSYIKVMIDNDRHKKGRFIFTGSQQFNLMRDLGDSLAGRIAIINLMPFCVNEKKKAFRESKRFSSAEDYFLSACLNGSFPELVVEKGIDAKIWYAAYLQTYLERDVRSMYHVENLLDFQRFIQLLATRCSQVLNLSSFSQELGVSVNTVKRWLSTLTATRIIYLLLPYYQNLGKRITKSPKVYFLDTGLACHLLGIRDKETLMRGPMSGAIFENFCIQETIKYMENHGLDARIYYMRLQNNLEVDIIVQKGTMLYPVECKASKTPRYAMAESLIRFRRLFSKLGVMPGRIISLCEENSRLSENVSIQRIDDYFKWLFEIQAE